MIKRSSLLLFGLAASSLVPFSCHPSKFFVSFMKFISASTVVLGVLLAGSVNAATYKVTDMFQGASFFSGFSFFSQADPTHGRV